MPYPDHIDLFTEKLNKKLDGGSYTFEEVLPITDGKYEGPLGHDNIANSTIRVYTGSLFTGDEITNFIVSIPSSTPWKRLMKVFAGVEQVYVTYETQGDQIEAEDMNAVQTSIVATQEEVDRYKEANDLAVEALDDRLTAAETDKVDKVAGKGLSTEDYTTAEKSKLAGVAANANNYVHPNHTGDVTSTGDGATAIAAGVIVDADVNASAAIGWSKISKTGSSLTDLATRSAGDLSSGTLPGARMPAISGDITMSAGSTTAAITSGVIVNADINDSAAIDASKIANGSVSNTEFQYLDGVTSAIQTQIDRMGDYLQAQFILSGGGTVTWSSGNYLKWTARFIVLPMDKAIVPNGFIEVFMPSVGTDVVGVGSTTPVTVTSDGIYMNPANWTTLYAVHNPGDNTITLKIANYSVLTAGMVTPNMIIIAAVNASEGTLKLGTGQILPPGTSVSSGKIDAAQIANGNVSNTEFQYLDGVTSAIQTQLNGKQASDATLTALAAYNTNGLLTQTAADTFAGRTITGTLNRIAVTNGNGVSGNPTLDIGTDVVTLSGTQTLTNKSISATQIDSGTLPAARMPALTGDITMSAGTNTTAIASGAVVNADINASAAIDATKIANGSVSNAEFQYLDGVTNAIQTQLNGKQASDATLTALAAYNTNGLLTQTAADTFVGRTITGTSNRILVTNGNGVSGNPTLDIGSDIVTLVGTQTLTNKSISAGQVNSGTLDAARLPAASTSAQGIVQLKDATNSTSTTQAATANAVKTAYDLAELSQRSATFIVAASDSSNASKTCADYICDGTEDQVEINAAILALPASGGKVLLMEGTFITGGTITTVSNLTIQGQGRSTVIQLEDSHNTNTPLITISSLEHVVIQDLVLDGNSDNQSSGEEPQITMSNSHYCSFRNLYLINSNGIGFRILTDSSNNIIDKCWIENCVYNGVLISNSSNNIVSNNIVIDNAAYGIFISVHSGGSSQNNLVTGNIISDSGAVGIAVYDSNYNNIQNNVIRKGSTSSVYGIHIVSGTGNFVTNNDLYSSGTSAAFSDSGTGTITTAGNRTT